MKPRKLHAYEVALRMARVKELRAQAALAAAVDQQTMAQQQVDAVEMARQTLLHASSARVIDGQRMDVARYELLAKLDTALSNRLQKANDTLDTTVMQRAEKAAENVLAKRRRENVAAHLDSLRFAHAHALAAKAVEDGIELWLENREKSV